MNSKEETFLFVCVCVCARTQVPAGDRKGGCGSLGALVAGIWGMPGFFLIWAPNSGLLKEQQALLTAEPFPGKEGP